MTEKAQPAETGQADFRSFFEFSPGLYLVLLPDSPRFTIVAVSDSYLRQTETRREGILGRGIFEVLPANPSDPSTSAALSLTASFNRVISNQAPEAMPIQRHDIRSLKEGSAVFIPKYWIAVNTPVFGPNGKVTFVIHQIEDVTEAEQIRQVEAARIRSLLLNDEKKVGTDAGRLLSFGKFGIKCLNKPFIVVPLLLAAAVAGVLIWQVNYLISLNEWVEHTDQVIAQTHLIEGQVIELQNSVRGFVIAGDPIYLEPYYAGKRTLPSTIATFEMLTSDNPSQKIRMDRVEGLLKDWYKEATITIDLKTSGKNLTSRIEIHRGKTLIDSIQAILGEIISHEKQLKRQRVSSTQDGSRKLFRTLVASLVVLVLLILRAVVMRLKAENVLRDSEMRFRLMVENSKDYAIFMLNPQGYIVSWNMAAQRIKGYASEEILGKNFSLFYLPEDQKAGKPDKALKVAATEGRVVDEGWRLRKDGSKFWANMTISAIQVQGEIKGFVEITRDLTERKRTEDQLRASEEKYRVLLQGAHDAILAIDYEGCIQLVNPQVLNWFGYTEDELIGKPVEILIPERFRTHHVGLRHGYIERPKPRPMGAGLALYARRKDGSEFPIDVSLSPMDIEGCTYVTAMIRDISERRKLEKERDRLLENEKKANLLKDEFIATLSHELRTPITTILSWVQLLRTGTLDSDKVKRGIEILEQSSLAQGRLIDDLLDVSRIQAGKLNVKIQETDPKKVVLAAIDATRSLAASKSIKIETEMDPSMGTIFVDPTRLQQILWNLITNSIKFSSHGGRIWIRTERIPSTTGDAICLKVRDNGKGIAPAFLPIIFERFTQVESTSTRSYGGLGLGLAIVRKLVEMHKGTIQVESPGEGKGSTFTVSLPINPLLKSENEVESKFEDQSESGADVTLKGLRIMVVDDEPNTREVFAEVLQSFGANVKAAGSACEALRVFEDFKPDVLVSDIAMPIEDGYSLITKIRALKSPLGQTPALALTAHAGRDDVQRTHLAGFQSHVAKPVDSNKLALAIAKLVGRK